MKAYNIMRKQATVGTYCMVLGFFHHSTGSMCRHDLSLIQLTKAS